ncbi:MAG: hypothetical protein ACK5LO_13955 [Leucobacter sp.]
MVDLGYGFDDSFSDQSTRTDGVPPSQGTVQHRRGNPERAAARIVTAPNVGLVARPRELTDRRLTISFSLSTNLVTVADRQACAKPVEFAASEVAAAPARCPQSGSLFAQKTEKSREHGSATRLTQSAP